MKIYESDKKFRIWVYSVSHASLLVRSERKYLDSEDYTIANSYNIDIEFWAVSYINIPTSFSNFVLNEIPIELLPQNIDAKLCENNERIFQFIIQDSKYYVIASGVIIGKNKWDYDRITSNLNLNHDEIILEIFDKNYKKNVTN